MLDVAEALASYRYLHVFSRGAWETIAADDRLEFLRHYLLRAKPVRAFAPRNTDSSTRWRFPPDH